MLNKVCLIGNLGIDPKISYTQQNAKIANLSLATSEYWKDKTTNEYKNNTLWHSIVIFNEQIVNFLEKNIFKGSKIYIEGSINYKKFTTKEGVEKNYTEIIATKVISLEKKESL